MDSISYCLYVHQIIQEDYGQHLLDQASHFLSPENSKKYELLKKHIKYLQKSPFINVKECLDCSFIYSDPYIAGDKRFYDLIFSKTNKISTK